MGIFMGRPIKMPHETSCMSIVFIKKFKGVSKKADLIIQ